MMLECEKSVFLRLQSVHKKKHNKQITTENASSRHLINLLTCCCCCCFLCHSNISVIYRRSVNLTTLLLDLRPPHDQRKLCDRADVQTHGSVVRARQTALANTAHRTSENANSTFLLTEMLGNLQFQGVLKNRYIAGQWLNMCGRVAS